MNDPIAASSPFDDFSFADNPDPRCPVVLVLDCSASMAETLPGEDRPAIAALNDGLDVLVAELNRDPLARRRVEVAVVSFATDAQVSADFATVEHLVLPSLVAGGTTSMGAALDLALDQVESRKATYRAAGIRYYRPWVMLITDGLPTDDVSEAARRIHAAEADGSLAFFAVGVQGADLETLARLGTRAPLALRGLAFDELFVWLSASQRAVSASTPEDKVALPSPQGWAEI